ncbi:MAG: peroxidase [Thermoanaerobaculia bacterium]|nr:peroxidase [Thermoanaerobaculia bacterium]
MSGDFDEWLQAIGSDWRQARLGLADEAMLRFVELLTLHPGQVRQNHVDELRKVGFTDTGIHDIVQVTALFSYYNRLADGLGADDEPEWTPTGTD